MNVIFVSAEYKRHFSISKSIKELPNRVGLVSTIQFLDSLKDVKKELEKNGKNAVIAGQVLGCDASNALKIKNQVDCFLFIGSGKFYIFGLAMNLEKEMPIFNFNPLSSEFSKFDWQEVRKLKQKRKAQEIRLLSADKVGVFVSSKSGQSALPRALKIKGELEKKGKKAYLFMADNLDAAQFENFSEIESWVNTACPGLFYDVGVYNM
jgi:2-(3-amino-3-carboxypropyl)histidine synthase